MKYLIIGFLLALPAANLSAQHSAESPVNIDSMMTWLRILSSDEYEGRETGMNGELKAAGFIASKFSAYNLHQPFFKNDSNPGYFQFFPYSTFQRDTGEQARRYAVNIAGILWGTEKPYEFVVVSAHYDHLGRRGSDVFNGADDNASGTAGVIELARQFNELAESGQRPLRSIMFVLFSGEEKGLLGSSFFTSGFPLMHEMVVANLNIDMVGRTDTAHEKHKPYIYLIGSNMLSADLHQMSETVNKTCCKVNLDYTYNDPKHPLRLYYRSDHYNFARFNIPVIFYFSGLHADYHKFGDDYDKIEPLQYEARMKLVFHTLLELANRPRKPALNAPIEK